jgi:electron transfer flavoprotein beta subunit
MDIIVLLSVVPDTTVRVKLTEEGLPELSQVPVVINPWDELALTRALALKEDPSSGVTGVKVVHVGPAAHDAVLRKALAMGAGEAIRIDGTPRDAWEAAAMLASYLKEQPQTLILAGIESSDYNGAATGLLTAEMLGIPSVAAISALEIEAGAVTVVRELEGAKEQLCINPPCLAVVQKGIAREPRMPSMRGIMMARRMNITVVPPPPTDPLTQITAYEMPPEKAPCKMIPAEKAEEILDLLDQEAKVIHLERHND